MRLERLSPAPFFKWAGGKKKLLPEILPRFPPKIGTYHEPFLGGGAVFFGLAAAGRIKQAFLSDANLELVTVYCAVRDDVEDVIARLSKFPNEKDFFLRMRAYDWKEYARSAAIAARFLYLNRVCFNGLYRVNAAGAFNVPFGDYPNSTICNARGLRAASRALQGVEIKCSDFDQALKNVKPGDCVYFDPPYVPISGSSDFTSYTKEGFGFTDHIRLRDAYRNLRRAGVFALLSNSACDATRELFKDFGPEEVMVGRSINSKGGKRGKIAELLVGGFHDDEE